ncbi:YchJ family protein [Glaciihabitans tibetensis]|nr:YchJ family metal-binding protein [Glaciihabitans tibetensis]
MTSSASSAASAASWPVLVVTSRCPCQSGETYGSCCGRLHNSPFHDAAARAVTAERLMRSRYSAFVVGDERYLLESWHPSTRPSTLELDPAQRWFGLEIRRTTLGGLLDSTGTVEFVAKFRLDGQVSEQHETSRFVRLDSRWVYLDGA